MYMMANPKPPKRMKAPKVKKPKAKSQPKVKVSQKQNINIRINNGSGGKLQERMTENYRTTPIITSYPLFREQFDVAPIIRNQNIAVEKQKEEEKDVSVKPNTTPIQVEEEVEKIVKTRKPRAIKLRTFLTPMKSAFKSVPSVDNLDEYDTTINKSDNDTESFFGNLYQTQPPYVEENEPQIKKKRPPRTDEQKERQKILRKISIAKKKSN